MVRRSSGSAWRAWAMSASSSSVAAPSAIRSSSVISGTVSPSGATPSGSIATISSSVGEPLSASTRPGRYLLASIAIHRTSAWSSMYRTASGVQVG